MHDDYLTLDLFIFKWYSCKEKWTFKIWMLLCWFWCCPSSPNKDNIFKPLKIILVFILMIIQFFKKKIGINRS